MAAAPRVALGELRAILKPPPVRESFPFSLNGGGGIPRGAITELVGAPGLGKTRLATRFLAENPTLQAAWVEDRLTVFPPAVEQQGVALGRVFFVEAGALLVWAALQALGSGAFEVVMLSSSQEIDEVPLRRLQLAAEKAQASVLLLSERRCARGRWAISKAREAAVTPGGERAVERGRERAYA